MQFSRASIRYARALYVLAEEYGQNEQVYEDMRMLLDLLTDAKEVRIWMASPIIPDYLKQRAVNLLFKNRLDTLSIRFINLVIAKNRSADIYGIMREYVELYRSNRNIARVVVKTPSPLNPEERSAFEEWFRVHIPDREVEMVDKVKPALLGGFTLQVGWRYVDLSVAGRLQQVRRELDKKLYQKK